MTNKKLITLEGFLENFPKDKRSGKTIAFTNGCFDVLHFGHVEYLERSKKMADLLVVGLNSDRSVRAIKGPKRPLNSERARAAVLSGLESVDYVIFFDEDNPLRLIEAIEPDILIKGGDWPVDEIIGSNIVRSYGGDVKTLDFAEGYSTTGLVEKILERYKDDR